MAKEEVIDILGAELHEGLVTAFPKYTLPKGACSFIQNVDWTRKRGRICKRRGIQQEQAELAGGNQVSGLWQYVQTNGTVKLIASRNNDVYDVAAGVWTSKFTGTMAGASVNFATFNGLLLMVAPTEATQKWDGVTASFAVLLGTPPANGKFIVKWKNRAWIANTASGKSRLHYSAEGNPEDWTTVGSAGFIDIDKDDGDEITGIVPIGPVLYIFKKRTVHRLTGHAPSSFDVQPIVLNRGCTAPRSLVAMGPFVMYMSDYGIHSINPNGNVDGLLSDAIQFDIEDLTAAAKLGAVAGKIRDLYILAYDSDGDGKNDKAFTLDVRTGAWSVWTNIKASVFANTIDSTLLSGGSDKTIIRLMNSGEDDEGTAIEMIWRSKQFDCGDWTGFKNILDIWVAAKPITGKTLTVRSRMDGVQVDTFTESLTPFQISATDIDSKIIGKDGATALPPGRFFEIEFYNNELAAPIEIAGLNVMANYGSREQAN